MGLFSKRPEPDFDDELPRSSMPVVQTVVSSGASTPVRPGEVRVTAANPNAGPQQSIERRPHDPTAPVVGPAIQPPPPPSSSRFGIEDAIRLLRELPGRESSSVREAVQKTLEFMNVDLDKLVEDANNKDLQLEQRAAGLQREVETHEALALAAKKQIAALQSERAELESAKNWMLEHRSRTASEPHGLDRVVRGTPVR